MKNSPFTLLLLIFSFSQSFAIDEPDVVQTKLKSVMVYRVGAEMVHSFKTSLHEGTNEILLEGLSNQLDLSSVQVGGAEKLSILSVEFSSDYLKPTVATIVARRLRDSLQVLGEEIDRNKVILQTDRELMDVLKANKELKGTQKGLSISELMKMMDYYRTKTLELQFEMNGLNSKNRKLEEQRGRLQSQLAEEEKRGQLPGGRLKLQVITNLAGNYDMTISYITARAGWLPGYDLKVESISKPIKLIYKARMVQTTGIDWKQVKLSLSTSMPNQRGNAPVFKNWFLSYIDPIQKINRNNALMNQVPGYVNGKPVSAQLSEVIVSAYGTKKSLDEDETVDVKLRGIASSNNGSKLYFINGRSASAEEISKLDPGHVKSIETIDGARAASLYGSKAAGGAVMLTMKDELSDYVNVKDNEMDVVFDIDLPYDIPSTGKEQQVVIQENDASAKYQYYSAPKLDKDAYLLGQVSDWESLHLLPGEANIIFEGTYIGHSTVDPQSTLDTLALTLGRDKRVVVKREKLQDFSSVKFLGDSKKQVFTYEITVKNNKKEKINMILKDQYPLSTNKEIEVELLESGKASVNSETGVLTWQLDIAPGELKKIRVSYSVKYPKDKVVNAD